MDIFNLTFTGNLTEDAVKMDFKENGKTVYNFTVATNLSEKNTLFLSCNYWVKLKTAKEGEEQVDKLLERLKKGKRITLSSEYATITKNESPKTNTVYQSLSITAKNIIFN